MSAQKPEYWQWRRKSECWDISQIWRHEVFATTDDSEVRQLFAAPPAQRLTDALVDDLSREMVKGGKSVNWLVRAIEAAILAKG